MFPFVERIRNEKGFEKPLEKIDFLISQKDKKPFCFLPYDVFEKILGDVLFAFLGFYDEENLLPEKRLELFIDETKKLTIKKDFERLCRENRLWELSLLLGRDEIENIDAHNRNCEVYDMAVYLDNRSVIKLLIERNRKFTRDLFINQCFEGNLDQVKFLYENIVIPEKIFTSQKRGTVYICKCAILYAAVCGHLEIVKFLCEKNAGKILSKDYRDIHDDILYTNHHGVIEFLKTLF